MPPKKIPKEPRRRSMRIQNKEEDKQRTNLKDLLKRGTSNLEKKRAERDGDFTFNRSQSQPNGSHTSETSKPRIAVKKGKVRRLQAEDMQITPDQEERQKKQKLKQRQIAATQVVHQHDDYEEHSTSFQVALPVSDTPIIRRNKELRDKNGGRRSSLNNRGKRVSSIGNGFVGVPHEKVPTSEYYKHLDHSLPDPHKMRQLLTWCAKKVSDEDKNRHIKQKNKLPSEELTALNIAKVIKEEIVNDLTSGKINISWWNREDEGDEGSSTNVEKTLLPNERNVKNAEVLGQLKERLDHLKASCAEWEKNMSKHIELPPVSLESVHLNTEDVQKVLDNSLLKELSQIEDTTFQDISQNLELSMDSFSQFVHHLKSSSEVRKKFASLKSQKLSQILDSTFDDSMLHKITHNEFSKDLDAQQLLKGISRLDQ